MVQSQDSGCEVSEFPTVYMTSANRVDLNSSKEGLQKKKNEVNM